MKIQSPISHKIMGFFPHAQTIHARLSLWRLQSHAQSLLIGRITLPMHPNQDASAHASQLGCICSSRHIHMCISIHTHTTSTTVNLHVPTSTPAVLCNAVEQSAVLVISISRTCTYTHNIYDSQFTCTH